MVGEYMRHLLKKLKKLKIGRRVISIVLVVTMLVGVSPFEYFDFHLFEHTPFIVHADSRKATVTINDLDELVTYSIQYSSNAESYSEDTLMITLNSGMIHTINDNYIPLGTEEWPFNGEIYITQTYGENWYFELSKPLFSYVTDSVKINYSGAEYSEEPIELEFRRNSSSNVCPLFAENVVHDPKLSATWKIKSTPYIDSAENSWTYDFGGVCGTVGEDVDVSIRFDNSSYPSSQGEYSSVVVDGDAGLICGSMGDNSNINLSLSGTNTFCTVTSTSGNAGGLVGSMSSGSTLNIVSNSFIPEPLREITATSGYAGGIVGCCDGGQVVFTTAPEGETAVYTTICDYITGTLGAGAIAGYYSNYVEKVGDTTTPQPVAINLENFDIDCTVSANAAGGLFGELYGTSDISIIGTSSGANDINVTGSSVTNFGGIAGNYSTSTLNNTLLVNGVTTNTDADFTGTSHYGGVVGKINGNEAAFIKVDNLSHNSTSGYDQATAFGGVIGDAGSNGSLLDIGNITVDTAGAFNGGGVVGILDTGVLRLSGTTDLSSATSSPGNRNYGQIVGIRKDSLVYAVGSGSDSNWTYARSNTDVQADDIGTWGSVLRLQGIETDVLTFDGTNHTVTVKSPVTTNISTVSDFTKTALNMQLNNGDNGALKFEDSTNTHSVLLGTNITFASSTNTIPIDLTGSGNIGLMRDDYKDNVSEIGVYTGTISGGKINLSIGERYGSYTSVNTIGKGEIVNHRYNGLIARSGVNSTANASNITVGGTINVDGKLNTTYVGGVIASAEKGAILTNITSEEIININSLDSETRILRVGGVAGYITGGDISVSNSVINTSIALSGTLKTEGDHYHSVAGAVGRIDSNNNNIEVDAISIKPTLSYGGNSGDVHLAGFIADINGKANMTLTGVEVNGTSISNSGTSHIGGFLGMHWLKTDVSFTANNGVIVSGNNTLATSSSSVCVPGLVQKATGHWTVPEKGIQLLGMTISGPAKSLGILVHDGYDGSDGLYLELAHKDSYSLSNTGIIIPEPTEFYDELVTYTGSDILSNGSKGIISITTDGELIMDGTSCNTYQNKYNQSKVTNSKSRYYYNLSSISSKETKSDGEKLLLWSLNKYAATNIKSNFADSFGSNPLSGNFDLEHISYYPIDAPSGLTIGDATFVFYNSKIEASEIGTGNSDGSCRTTRGASQHYLMHSGVFRNVSNTLTTNGNIHFKGSIGCSSGYSGALINGTLSGTLTTSDSKEIVFEGLTLSDPSKYLFINKATTNSKMTIRGIRTGGGKDFNNADKSSETRYMAGTTVASSLIGDVSGTGIQISFDRIKLDSRTTAGSPSDLASQYGTTKSIFSGATLLNKFAVDKNSTGTYNFAENLDWNSGTHNANVTYGKEIKTSVEYADKQQKYFDQVNFVDPVNNPSARTEVYGFDTGFLPYVRYSSATTTGDDATRELKVNVSVEGITEGCGTYNHPYEITLGSQFVNIATAINKSSYPNSLRLPKVQGSAYTNSISTHWCEEKSSCAEYTHGSGNYTYTENGTTFTWTEDQVSLYLASAYYLVKNNITIEGTYLGLGATPASDTNKTGKYAFRGVIVGASDDGSVKISMSVPKSSEISNYENTHGLITMSNGSVVKNLTIEVTPYANDKYNYRVNDNKAYAYNEEFSNYGAVINKIMGGDNIIDNVSVNFTSDFKVRDDNDYKATVGGYVGCVVNGGLIFRDVDDTSLTGFNVIKVNSNGQPQSVTCNGNTITNLTDEKDLIHIHVNPFVGRVINGYAIRESDHYAFSEDGATYGDGESRENAVEVTMHNTRKNYSIPDIDTTSTNLLTFSQSTSGGSYDTITVPDSQSLFIMSIIAQSGSGCASSDNGEYAYNISYCGENTKDRSYAGTTQQNNKATHWASYDNVGGDNKGDDYNLSLRDTINEKTAVPYIIKKYTSSYDNGTKYPARTLTKRTFYVNLAEGETYYLPDCFRGIGFLGSNTLDDNMKIYGFNGNGTTNNPTVIDVNSEYFLNRKGDDPYFGSNINNEYMVGIGLFNNLKQSSSTGFNRKYESDSKYQITNFTLQGYLSAHHVSSSGEDQNANPTDNRDKVSMNTAGLIPTVLDNNVTLFNFSNIDFKKIHINSYAYAGGFVAYTNSSGVMIYINNCNADGFRIDGSGRIAGFVGSYDTNTNKESGIHINTGLDSSGKDSFTCVMKNTIINNKLSTDVKHNYTAGILGCVYSAENNINLPADNGDNARGHLILRNVTIEGGNAETNYIGNKNNPSGSSGGILGGGSGKVNGCLIQNCVIKDIDIYGKYAGGIMGENANRNSGMGSKTGVRIVGCTVTGKLDDHNDPQYTIMGLYYAGGVYGDTRDTNTTIHPKYKSVSANDSDYVEYKTDIDGVYIYGYNIYSVNESNANDKFDTDNNNLKTRVAAGGLIGSNNENRTIQNCKVERCVIDVGTNATSATNTPSGGLIGRMNSGTLYSYNIEVKDCEFLTHQWDKNAAIGEGQTMIEARARNTQKAYATDTNTPISGMKCGNVIGDGNSKDVYITAIHVEGCETADFTNISSKSFVVYSDYNGICNTDEKGVSTSSLTTNKQGSATYTDVTAGGLGEYFPHVNVSPVTSMGSDSSNNKDVFLTSDGAALYSDSGELKPVVNAIVNGDKYSKVVNQDSGNAIKSALNLAESTNGISTYKTEMGSLPAGVEDFAVVSISTENAVESTNLITNYIKAVTNTEADYRYDISNNSSDNSSNKFSKNYAINIYPCTYNSSKGCYEINASGKTAGLVRDGLSYKMTGGYADSNQPDFQFSLIDVMFLNPSNDKEVAYHLYVPVLTKKMMMYEFKSASLSGTDVKGADFKNYGNTLAENLNSWFTGYVHYGYSQTELQTLLDSGAGLDWNSNKTIQLKYTTSSVEAKLGGNTQIVLVDRNKSDQYYYATLDTFRGPNDTDGSYDNLTLDTFKSKLDETGTPFATATFADMLEQQGFKIAVDQSATTHSDYFYDSTTDPSEATVTVDGNMYKYVSGGNGHVKLEIKYYDENNQEDTDKLLEENYYLCIKADGNSVYNYSIRTPYAIPGSTGKPTLRVSNLKESEITNIIMGDLYTQNVTLQVHNVDQEKNPKGSNANEIDGIYHRLKVSLVNTITLNGSSAEQDFILSHLTNESIHLYQDYVVTLTARDESGERVEILGSPSVTTDFNFAGNGRSGSDTITQNGLGGTSIQLGMHDIKEYLSKSAAIISAEAVINFDEEWQYHAEFPVQAGSDDYTGVNVSAASNLAYNPETILYTSMTKDPAIPSNKYFFIKDSEEANLIYNFKSGILDEYDEAGYSSFNYSQQGENPKNFKEMDRTFVPVQTVATYDGTKLKKVDFDKAKNIKYSLYLYRKTDSGSDVSYVPVTNIYDYLINDEDSVFIKVNSGVKSDYASGGLMTKTDGNELTYTAEIDHDAFNKIDDQIIDANIDFDIKTGGSFVEYANYRVVLYVDLLDKDGNPINENSTAHDWVVYTNAKINPTMLSVTEAGQ